MDVAQPVADDVAQEGHAVMLGIAGQVGLVVGDDRDVILPPDQHPADREQRRAEQVDQVGLEVVEVVDDDGMRQRQAGFRRGGDAERGQRDHLTAADRRRRDVRREHQHFAPGLLKITQGQIGGFGNAVDFGQKGFGEDRDPLDRR